MRAVGKERVRERASLLMITTMEPFRDRLNGATSGSRLVQILERVLSSRFTIVEIEHTAKSFAAMNRIIA